MTEGYNKILINEIQSIIKILMKVMRIGLHLEKNLFSLLNYFNEEKNEVTQACDIELNVILRT